LLGSPSKQLAIIQTEFGFASVDALKVWTEPLNLCRILACMMLWSSKRTGPTHPSRWVLMPSIEPTKALFSPQTRYCTWHSQRVSYHHHHHH
jgi:hypothetical protein